MASGWRRLVRAAAGRCGGYDAVVRPVCVRCSPVVRRASVAVCVVAVGCCAARCCVLRVPVRGVLPRWRGVCVSVVLAAGRPRSSYSLRVLLVRLPLLVRRLRVLDRLVHGLPACAAVPLSSRQATKPLAARACRFCCGRAGARPVAKAAEPKQTSSDGPGTPPTCIIMRLCTQAHIRLS